MMTAGYQYKNKPRNIFRFALAAYRLLQDPEDIEEAAIVELTFNRSHWGKKLARWDLVVTELLAQYPQLTRIVAEKSRMAKVDLQLLLTLPAGTLGHTLALIETERGYDPNLVDPLPDTTDGEWLVAHLYETHDFWHVLTGFNFDIEGEFGVAGFYLAQMRNNTFFVFMVSLLLMKSVWHDREALAVQLRAFCDGYQIGQRSEPLVGLDWSQLWDRNLEALRQDLGIAQAGRIDITALAA